MYKTKLSAIVKYIDWDKLPNIFGPKEIYKLIPEIISLKTVYKLFNDPGFPATKVSGVLITTRDCFLSWLQGEINRNKVGYETILDNYESEIEEDEEKPIHGILPRDQDWTNEEDIMKFIEENVKRKAKS